MSISTRPWLRRGTISILGGATLVLAAPLAAQAHVGVTADTTAAGSQALLTLNVPHGCEGSPTTRLTLTVPAGINEVLPTVEAGWKVTKTSEKLAEPLTLEDGDQLTERTTQVVWTARTPLPDGFRAALSLEVELPAEAEGQTLVFPVKQDCEKGSTDWSQVGGAGVSEDDLEHPASVITVTAAAAGDDHGGSHGAASPAGEVDHSAHETADAAAAPAAASSTADSTADTALASSDVADNGSGTGLAVAGLVAGLLGLAAGALALVRTRSAGSARRD